MGSGKGVPISFHHETQGHFTVQCPKVHLTIVAADREIGTHSRLKVVGVNGIEPDEPLGFSRVC